MPNNPIEFISTDLDSRLSNSIGRIGGTIINNVLQPRTKEIKDYWQIELLGGEKKAVRAYNESNTGIRIDIRNARYGQFSVRLTPDNCLIVQMSDGPEMFRYNMRFGQGVLGPALYYEKIGIVGPPDLFKLLKELRSFIEESDCGKKQRYRSLLKPIIDEYIKLAS